MPSPGGYFGRRRIKDLRRYKGNTLEIVDLVVDREDERLARATPEALCQNSGVPLEDFGRGAE
jgi:hypothetical protein